LSSKIELSVGRELLDGLLGDHLYGASEFQTIRRLMKRHPGKQCEEEAVVPASSHYQRDQKASSYLLVELYKLGGASPLFPNIFPFVSNLSRANCSLHGCAWRLLTPRLWKKFLPQFPVLTQAFPMAIWGSIINSPKKYGTDCLCSAEFRRPKSPI